MPGDENVFLDQVDRLAEISARLRPIDQLDQTPCWPYDWTVRRTLNLYEAKSRLSALVEEAAAGHEIIIAKAGKPRAQLGPLRPAKRRRPGGAKGRVWVAHDFDAPLPPELLAAFAGHNKR